MRSVVRQGALAGAGLAAQRDGKLRKPAQVKYNTCKNTRIKPWQHGTEASNALPSVHIMLSADSNSKALPGGSLSTIIGMRAGTM